MGNIFQDCLLEVNNLRQFSLLKCLRKYLARPVERGLWGSPWLWHFNDTSCSLRSWTNISNQDVKVEVYTPPKSLEYLTINITQRDLPHQKQLILSLSEWGSETPFWTRRQSRNAGEWDPHILEVQIASTLMVLKYLQTLHTQQAP